MPNVLGRAASSSEMGAEFYDISLIAERVGIVVRLTWLPPC
jgi:hypothetical protein